MSEAKWDATESRWDVQSPSPPTYWDNVKAIIAVFFPQYADPDSPDYVDPGMLDQLLYISEQSRPWCLPEDRANFAQAMFTAYLISVQKETSSGEMVQVTAGPVISEKEGDITINYGSASGGTAGTSKRPSSDPWDAWNRLWNLCTKGAVTTRFGDPCQSPSKTLIVDGNELTWISRNSAVALLKSG